jgi:hypothetical protein
MGGTYRPNEPPTAFLNPGCALWITQEEVASFCRQWRPFPLEAAVSIRPTWSHD